MDWPHLSKSSDQNHAISLHLETTGGRYEDDQGKPAAMDCGQTKMMDDSWGQLEILAQEIDGWTAPVGDRYSKTGPKALPMLRILI